MAPNSLARVAAAASIIFGTAGVIAPEALGAAFGVSLDPVGVALARLASASYLGLGILNWLARNLTDPSAWRAIAGGNLAGWTISAGVVTVNVLAGLGDSRAWIIVALQVGFTVAWAFAYMRATRPFTEPEAARA